MHDIYEEINDVDLLCDTAKWYDYCEGAIDSGWFLRFICGNISFAISPDAWTKNAPIPILNRQQELIQHMSGRILDIGCNTGVFVLRLRQLGLDAHGIDGAQTFVKIAKAYAQLFKVEPTIFDRGLIQSTSKLDESFDCVHAQEIIEHLPDASLAVAEVHRILRRGGLFLGSVPYKEEPHHHPGHFVYFDEEVVEKMLSPDFKIEKLIVTGSKFPNGHKKSKKDTKQLLWVARKK